MDESGVKLRHGILAEARSAPHNKHLDERRGEKDVHKPVTPVKLRHSVDRAQSCRQSRNDARRAELFNMRFAQEPAMKFATLIGIGFLSCVGLLSGAGAADFVPADEPIVQMPIGTEARTYYREHRLRAYEKTRASTTQGATCVTPKLVCWIDESVMGGDPCACETSHFGVVPGTVGG